MKKIGKFFGLIVIGYVLLSLLLMGFVTVYRTYYPPVSEFDDLWLLPFMPVLALPASVLVILTLLIGFVLVKYFGVSKKIIGIIILTVVVIAGAIFVFNRIVPPPITNYDDAMILAEEAAKTKNYNLCKERIPEGKVSLREMCLEKAALSSLDSKFCEYMRDPSYCISKIK